jgi:hypothetical protein
MDEDGDPANHPEGNSPLAVAQIDPGEQRHQQSHHAQNDDMFELRRHRPSAAVSVHGWDRPGRLRREGLGSHGCTA